MKVTEINVGYAQALRVRSVDGAFDPIPDVEREVYLVHSDRQTLLHYDDAVYSVVGVSPADNEALLALVGSGLPNIVYVARARPRALVLEARRFSHQRRVADSLSIGVDDKALTELQRRFRVSGTLASIAAWLEDRLLLASRAGGPDGARRVLVSGDRHGRLDTFRIHGYRIAVDVRRHGERLRIERIVRGGRPGARRIVMLYAPISFVDATLSADIAGEVQTTLSEIMSDDGSYLRIWQDYQAREREVLTRRAQALGALVYTSRERRRDRGWSFKLESKDELERIASFGVQGRFELEAGETPPTLTNSKTLFAGPRQRPQLERLSAAIMKINTLSCRVDLFPPEEDDEQPTPPKEGYLYLSLAGDRARLRRRERAEEALRTGTCPMPQLGLLMEGRPAPAARRPRRDPMSPGVREVFGGASPTRRQLDAIDYAINTPDICLIQGPPGTGKTKVITAIERRLAELADEGLEVSHRILVSAAQHDAVENVVHRTQVFGLPPVKVGRRRRGADAELDPTALFADDRAEQLRARLRVMPDAERVARARRIVVSCVRARTLPAELATSIHEVTDCLGALIPPALRDRALARAAALARPHGAADPEELELLVRAARSVRVDAGAFEDDGPHHASKALRRLDDVLLPDERAYLERCAALEPGTAPSWIEDGRVFRNALLDRVTRVEKPVHSRDDETRALLLEILDTVERRRLASREGVDAVLAEYLHDFETDPTGVRETLQHYTVVLAATLQQAASHTMRVLRGIDAGDVAFESVIIDEAARANPLDLFIPLSMAKRRVVLVGDHRQLPHLLEPDVEHELADEVRDGAVEAEVLRAVQASLFERLWVTLRKLEANDYNRRTVTLNAQFRMHPVLGRFVSSVFYEANGDDEIESPRPAEDFEHRLPGYSDAVSGRVAAWIDVPAARGRERRGASKSRPCEARVIAREVMRLIEHDASLSFGVIAFYAAQVDEIGRAMIEVGLTEATTGDLGWRVKGRWSMTLGPDGRPVERLRVGTVDAFQGKEFDVVFLSVTRTNDLPEETDKQRRRKYGHLLLENRLCVAMSRQRRLLVTVGDIAFVRAAGPLRALRSYVELCGGSNGVLL